MTQQASTLGFALLGLLEQQPRSGYALRKVFASSPMGHYSSSPGAIYPALRRLEQQGLVRGSVDRSRVGRPKKAFRTTPKGRRALEAWILQPLCRDDVIWRLEDLLLRFAFMAGLVGPADTRRFLTDLAREVEAHVKNLKGHLAALREQEGPPHGRLALENGILAYEAQARWARHALKAFSD